MAAILFRLGLLAAGLGVVEIGLGEAVVRASVLGWAVVLLGLGLIVAGTAGFMGPLFGGPKRGGSPDA